MLVDYNSDSDSDSAATAPAPAPASAGPASKLKPGSLIQKDSTGVRKIVVQLPDASTVDADEPPTKRARVGGGGLSGLSALLPAPKRSGANTPLVSMKNSEGVGRVLGGGAARKEDEFLVVMPEENQGPEEEPPIASSPKEKEEERKAAPVSVATTTQFIPQSVSRKPIQPASAFRRKGATKTTSPASATLAAKPAKVSLFGSGKFRLVYSSLFPSSRY